MKLFSAPSSQQHLRHLINRKSLQTRLTAGVVLACVVGVGSLAGWMGWQMRQIFLATHKAKTATIAQRFTADVAQYQPMLGTQRAMQKVIDYRATGDMAIWVESTTGELMAQSETLTLGSWQQSGVSDQLLQLSLQNTLIVRPLDDWTLVICASPFTLTDGTTGVLYVADDITADFASVNRLLVHLALISSLVMGLLSVLIALYVRRSLSPLRQLNRVAGTVTANTLANSQLTLQNAPSELEELAQTYNMMLDRLSGEWLRQKRFVNDLSHELRTPLTLVQGYLQSTLRRCQTLTPPQREGLQVAAAEADRTIRLLQQFLELVRLENGQLPFERRSVDLKQVVQDVVTLTQYRVQTSGVPQLDPSPVLTSAAESRITADIQAYPLMATVDADRLREALMHLIDNAVMYSEPHQPIIVRLRQQGDQALIQVCDQGRGIDPAHHCDIFEPFYRVDEDRCRTTGGTGLGLTVVRALVRSLDGTIRVQSALGQGSTFTITLPLQEPPL